MFIVYYAVYTVELVADSTETFNGWTNNYTDYDYDELIDSLNQTRALTVALKIVTCICYVGLVVVVIVGFVLLRRKVSHNLFAQIKYIFLD